MGNWRAFASGLAGAIVLTAVHQAARKVTPNAPRMDIYGERGIAKVMRAMGKEPPAGENLHNAALAGDIVSNTLHYSLAASGEAKDAPLRGLLLGLTAGLGALVLPPKLGLGKEPSNRRTSTQVMTVAWYTLGGLASGIAYRCLARNSSSS